MIFSNIVIYKKKISVEYYINKTIKTKEIWNQINVLSMEYILGANFRLPLLHMSKSYLWTEETSQRINEFSFGYMFNPTLYINKVLREQVKTCFKNTFGTYTNKYIHKTLQKKYKSACIICFYALGNINPRKMFKVLSCVIYTILDR